MARVALLCLLLVQAVQSFDIGVNLAGSTKYTQNKYDINLGSYSIPNGGSSVTTAGKLRFESQWGGLRKYPNIVSGPWQSMNNLISTFFFNSVIRMSGFEKDQPMKFKIYSHDTSTNNIHPHHVGKKDRVLITDKGGRQQEIVFTRGNKGNNPESGDVGVHEFTVTSNDSGSLILVCEGVCNGFEITYLPKPTTTTATTTTFTTTTNTLVELAHRRIEDLHDALKDGSEVDKKIGDAVDLLEKENQDLKDLLEAYKTANDNAVQSARKEAQNAQSEIKGLRKEVAELKTSLEVMTQIFKETIRMEPKEDDGDTEFESSECKPGICDPSFNTKDGNSAAIHVCCGDLKIHAKRCSVDPCELQKDIEKLKYRVSLDDDI